MVSGMVSRQSTFPMQSKVGLARARHPPASHVGSSSQPQAMPSRLTDFGAVRSPEDERAPGTSSLPQNNYTNGANGWRGGNIWGNGTLGSGFASRERADFPAISAGSRANVGLENGSFRASLPEEIEGKTGSGSLVASSESDPWGPRRTTPWNPTDSAAQPISSQRRASSVSPVSQVQASQQAYVDPAQSRAYPMSRASIAGQGLGSKAVNLPANYASRRATEDGYVDLARLVELEQRQRSTDLRWTDAPHLHSPTEDRRSVANSEYFSSSSAAQSRSGSLPPSRHGSDPVQYPQPGDAFNRFSSNRGHTTSLSQTNGRYNERTDSVASDVMSSFARMSMDNKAIDQPMSLHKPSFSTPSGAGQFGHSSSFSRATIGDIPQSILGSEDISAGSFTPDGYPSQYDQSFPYRNYQLGNRGAMTPNGEFRPSYYSAGGTPPVYDHLYPSRSTQNGRQQHDGHPALLERKLRGVQQEQQAFIHPGYQQMLAAQYPRPFDAYSFPMHMGGIAPGIPMHIPSMPGMIQQLEPPKGPRQDESGTGLRSAMLDEFKHNSRSKRYELKVRRAHTP